MRCNVVIYCPGPCRDHSRPAWRRQGHDGWPSTLVLDNCSHSLCLHSTTWRSLCWHPGGTRFAGICAILRPASRLCHSCHASPTFLFSANCPSLTHRCQVTSLLSGDDLLMCQGTGQPAAASLPVTWRFERHAACRRYFPETHRSKSLTFVHSAYNLGSIIALCLTPLLIKQVGWPWALRIFSAAGLAWAVSARPLRLA